MFGFEVECFGLEGFYMEPEEFTCYECHWYNFANCVPLFCDYRYDLYNINGDCLAEK